MEQYRIQWKYLEPNSTVQGAGQWHNSKELLEDAIIYYNDKYKDEIHHWIQTS